jgi:hypothetical protein
MQQQQQQIVQPIDHGANSARELDAINISAQTAAIYVQEVVITFFFEKLSTLLLLPVYLPMCACIYPLIFMLTIIISLTQIVADSLACGYDHSPELTGRRAS